MPESVTVRRWSKIFFYKNIEDLIVAPINHISLLHLKSIFSSVAVASVCLIKFFPSKLTSRLSDKARGKKYEVIAMVINTPRFHYGHYEHIGYISALLCFLKITQTTAVHNMNFANIKDDNVSSIWASLKVLSNLNCITLIWHYALLTRTHVLFAIHNFIFCPELRNVNFLAIFLPFLATFCHF